VAKTIEKDCNNCDKLNKDCCKNCFEDHKHNIFECLEVNQLDFLMDQKQRIQYNSGETIVKQNTNSSYAICIKEGLAKVYVEGSKGKNLIVRLIGEGDFVTGGSLFNGNIQNFTISAITPTICCLIDSSRMAKLFTENSQFSIELLRHHSKRNNKLLKQMVDLTQKYMPGRVADTLLYLKNDILKENPFKVPLTRQDLADMSNMTKESLVRILQQFKESKLIRTQSSTIEILDENSLLSISKNG
jgi:CRP-like cAMP-binding protein